MRVFIIKSVNLLIVAGIIALYCINVRKVGEEKKSIAEKTDKKEVASDDGNNIYFADDGIYEGSGDGFGRIKTLIILILMYFIQQKIFFQAIRNILIMM